MPFYAPESLGERLGVAMLTPGANLRASPDGIPCSICPFDFGINAHTA